jgi:hypothetical protein
MLHAQAILWKYDADLDGEWNPAEVDSFFIAAGEDPIGQAGVMQLAR